MTKNKKYIYSFTKAFSRFVQNNQYQKRNMTTKQFEIIRKYCSIINRHPKSELTKQKMKMAHLGKKKPKYVGEKISRAKIGKCYWTDISYEKFKNTSKNNDGIINNRKLFGLKYGGKNRRKVTVDNVEYNSIKIACIALHISKQCFYNRLKNSYYINIKNNVYVTS